ncbi:MAG: hypothetical protein R2838_22475 [Caldilineaceae bacterium]
MTSSPFRLLPDAVDGHPAFGINLDPSHLVHQFLDPVELDQRTRTASITCTSRTRPADRPQQHPVVPSRLRRLPPRLGLRPPGHGDVGSGIPSCAP